MFNFTVSAKQILLMQCSKENIFWEVIPESAYKWTNFAVTYHILHSHFCSLLISLLSAKLNHCQEICTQEGSKRPRRELTIFGLGPQALLQHPENLSRGRIFGKKLNKSLFSVKRTTQKLATHLEFTPVSVNISSLFLQYNYLDLSFYWNSFEEW